MQASISTTELLYKLRENRTKHVETYEAAMQVYRQRLITEFESRLAQLDLSHEADEIAAVETYVKLPKPEVHTDDYDRAIAMVGWHQGETIELDEGQFAELVMDQWGWNKSFFSNTTSYISAR